MATIGFDICVDICLSGNFGTNFENHQMQWSLGGGGIGGAVKAGGSFNDSTEEKEYDFTGEYFAAKYAGGYVGGSLSDTLIHGKSPITDLGVMADMGMGCISAYSVTIPM